MDPISVIILILLKLLWLMQYYSKNLHVRTFLESAKKVLVFLGPSSVLIICHFIGY